MNKAEAETVRVDRRRLDELINQIGELVIGASMVEQDVLSMTGTNVASMASLGKVVRDLQEMSLALRMVPIGATCGPSSMAAGGNSEQSRVLGIAGSWKPPAHHG